MRLPAILSRSEFPTPELGALLLDGEVYRVDSCVSPIDEVPGPAQRAAALAGEIPARLIAEQHTAAWIWGAQPQPPQRHEVCADITARTRPAVGVLLSLREVVLVNEDTVTLSGLAVTTPMRTAIDLARFVPEWSDTEAEIVRALLRVGRVGVLECARAMNRRRNLPNKRIALERLAASLS